MSAVKGQLAQPIFSKIAPHEFLVAKLVRPSTEQENEDEKLDLKNELTTAAASLGTRPNGRTPSEARPFDVHMGALSQAHGSAAVRLGQTRIICGVRGEILPVTSIPQYRPSIIDTGPIGSKDDSAAASLPVVYPLSAAEIDNRRQLRDYDLLVPNLELNTGSAPEFLPGGPPSVLAQSLSTRLYELMHSSGIVDAEQLKIWQRPPTAQPSDDTQMTLDDDTGDDDDTQTQSPELKAYWTLYIDLLFLSFDGNPFDAAWAAVVAALKNTRLPLAQWDADRDSVVCSSLPRPSLRLRGLPVATTAVLCVENKRKQQLQSSRAAGAHWMLIDPDRLEESQCREASTIVLDCSTGSAMVQALSKSGGVLLGPSQMRQLSAYAERRWAEFLAALERQT